MHEGWSTPYYLYTKTDYIFFLNSYYFFLVSAFRIFLHKKGLANSLLIVIETECIVFI